jgi:hypothetical protein
MLELVVALAAEGADACICVYQPQHAAQRGRLACPVRSEEPGYAAGIHFEGHVGHRLHGAEALAESLDLDRRHVGHARLKLPDHTAGLGQGRTG